MEHADLTEKVIGAAIAVHKELGPGLLESVYEERMAIEMTLRHIPFERQKYLPITCRGVQVPAAYRMDFVVDGRVVVDLKATEHLLPVHHAQVLSYLRLAHCRVGLLINFNVAILIDGIKRFVNGFPDSVPPCLRGGA